MSDNVLRQDGGKIVKEDDTYILRQVFGDVYSALIAVLPNLGVATGSFKGKPKMLHNRRIK